MNYIIVQDNNPKGRALGLSKELFKLSRPEKGEDDVTEFLFGTIEHPVDGRVALAIDLEHEIPIHPSQSGERIAQVLSDDVSSEELVALTDLVSKNNRIKFGRIMPSVFVVHSKADLEADGWFETEI